EIPTIPSPIDNLQSTLEQLPLEQMSNSLNAVLQNISSGLADNKLGTTLDSIAATFEEARNLLGSMRADLTQTLNNLSTTSTAMDKNLPATLTSFREAMQSMAVAAEQLRTVTASAQRLLRHDSPAMNDFRRLLKESVETARSLRALADMLERNPETLLKGRRGSR
ncbi:MAG: MCE family protein, partial [Desulfovibrio sp.]|nr:MCE family protein [Desulfovibrio sp.]